jgi:hypothetical protein
MNEEWLKNLVSHPIFILISFAFGILGILFSFIFYFKSKKEKKPYFTTKTITLIENLSSEIESVKVLYDDKSIENLSISRIAFWNEGKQTISKDDIPVIDEIRIESVEETQFLDVQIIYENNPANNFNVELQEDKKLISLLFDYIDFEDIVVLQIIHTGKSCGDLKISGSVKGFGKIKNKLDVEVLFELKTMFYAISCVIIILFVGLITINILPHDNNKQTGWALLVILMICFFIIGLVSDYKVKRFRRKFKSLFVSDSNKFVD